MTHRGPFPPLPFCDSVNFCPCFIFLWYFLPCQCVWNCKKDSTPVRYKESSVKFLAIKARYNLLAPEQQILTSSEQTKAQPVVMGVGRCVVFILTA